MPDPNKPKPQTPPDSTPVQDPPVPAQSDPDVPPISDPRPVTPGNPPLPDMPDDTPDDDTRETSTSTLSGTTFTPIAPDLGADSDESQAWQIQSASRGTGSIEK